MAQKIGQDISLGSSYFVLYNRQENLESDRVLHMCTQFGHRFEIVRGLSCLVCSSI